MKILGLVLALCLIATSAMALGLTYEIPAGKVAEYVSDYVYIYKNTETWDDDADSETPEIPKYTDAQWVREHVRRWIVKQIKRGYYAQQRDGIVGIGVTDVN